MHGIGREIGRDIHSVIFHHLRERDDVVNPQFSASTNDIGSREPREKLGTFVSVGLYHKFGSGGEVSIVFQFFWVYFTDVRADGEISSGE